MCGGLAVAQFHLVLVAAFGIAFGRGEFHDELSVALELEVLDGEVEVGFDDEFH